MNNTNYDAGMQYERLARAIFGNCSKGRDPWGYTKQECFDSFIPTPSLKGKRILSTVLIAAILNPRYKEFEEQLKKNEDAVWVASTQEQIIMVIDSTIKLIGLS